MNAKRFKLFVNGQLQWAKPLLSKSETIENMYCYELGLKKFFASVVCNTTYLITTHQVDRYDQFQPGLHNDSTDVQQSPTYIVVRAAIQPSQQLNEDVAVRDDRAYENFESIDYVLMI